MLNPINPIKIIYHKEQIREVLNNKDSHPITIGLDISNLCNHNCIWCLYNNYKREHHYNMSQELIEKAICNSKQIGAFSICLSGGGEPTMNENINFAIKKCKEYKLQVSLNTNGDRLNILSDHSISYLSYIRVSLDAGTQKTHNLLHRPLKYFNSFDNILKNIRRIKENYNTVVGVGYLVHDKNYSEIYNLSKILKDIRVDYIQIRPLKNFDLSENKLNSVNAQIQNIKNIKIYESFSKMKDTIQKKEKSNVCYMNKLVGNIGPDGFVYACCELRGINPLGNIKDNSLYNILNSEKNKEIINSIDVSKCPSCKYAKTNEIIEEFIINDNCHRNFI